MAQRINIIIGQIKLTAELNDSPSAKALVEILPLGFWMSRWGDEYYGDCGLDVEEEPQGRTIMKVGELAIWPWLESISLWLLWETLACLCEPCQE